MKSVVYTLLIMVVLTVIGCSGEPFEVLGSNISPEIGSALISTRVPPFSRGVIQRLRVLVTSVDTAYMEPIDREMNFPVPGGNLSAGQVAEIPVGKRRFTVTAFDTERVLRFRGASDSEITDGQTSLVLVELGRIGGTVNFRTVIDLSGLDSSAVDSATLVALPLTSVLDILELIQESHHHQLGMLPLVSMGLGDQFSWLDKGIFSRQVTVSQLPSGRRKFVAHLRDLNSNGTLALADTITAIVDTVGEVEAVFNLELVQDNQTLLEIFSKTTLPGDSTVIVIVPKF